MVMYGVLGRGDPVKKPRTTNRAVGPFLSAAAVRIQARGETDVCQGQAFPGKQGAEQGSHEKVENNSLWSGLL